MQHVTGTTKARPNARPSLTPAAALPLAVMCTEACA